MSGYISPNGKFLAEENGEPLVGALLYTYLAGTTTQQATYQNSTLTTPNTNPVVMDSQGRATIFLNSALSYDFVLKRSDGSQVWTVSGIAAMATGADLAAEASARAAADTAESNARTAAVAAEASARAAAIVALSQYPKITILGATTAVSNVSSGLLFTGGTISNTFPTGSPSGYNSSTGEITIQSAWGDGWYLFRGLVTLSASAGGFTSTVNLKVNGIQRAIAAAIRNETAGGGARQVASFPIAVPPMYLGAGEVVKFTADFQNTSTTDSAVGAWFAWERVA